MEVFLGLTTFLFFALTLGLVFFMFFLMGVDDKEVDLYYKITRFFLAIAIVCFAISMYFLINL
jgi:cytochrome bd-type quinol oxidase subunit 1|tara:strand:+ start:56 stop:244 length:189 start_codon:yes stop_codon:yes gene_type:complete